MSSYELKDTGHGHGRPVQIVSRLPDQCPLSGHRSRLWQDIVRWPTSTEWVVDAGGVKSQGPN